mmetsp:Transcript_43315/g.137759  ORF Transcript_43315/g.137759 Transcript_43315/m.137759 type:complete len:275 (-) Transcript_43315:238-1062(-)
MGAGPRLLGWQRLPRRELGRPGAGRDAVLRAEGRGHGRQRTGGRVGRYRALHVRRALGGRGALVRGPLRGGHAGRPDREDRGGAEPEHRHRALGELARGARALRLRRRAGARGAGLRLLQAAGRPRRQARAHRGGPAAPGPAALGPRAAGQVPGPLPPGRAHGHRAGALPAPRALRRLRRLREPAARAAPGRAGRAAAGGGALRLGPQAPAERFPRPPQQHDQRDAAGGGGGGDRGAPARPAARADQGLGRLQRQRRGPGSALRRGTGAVHLRW